MGVTMDIRQLGNADPVSSPIGLGTRAFTGRQSRGAEQEALCIARVHQALDMGIAMLDTADHYGGGQVERLIGRAIAKRRGEALIATRGGVRFTSGGRVVGVDGSPRHLRQACNASLRRLGVDYVDLYYLDRHRDRGDEQVPVEESVGQLAELVRAGKIRHIGMIAPPARELRHAHAVHPITAISSEYSLCERRAEIEQLPAARDLGMAFVARSPLGGGLLTGHITTTDQNEAEGLHCGDRRCSRESLARNGNLLRAAQEIATHLDLSLSRLALAWLLSRPGVIPIPSTRNPLHLEMNAAAVSVRLGRGVHKRLTALFPPAPAGD
jgi:aryl-alcohol dehydrogenase-like predicted oxidoreductase